MNSGADCAANLQPAAALMEKALRTDAPNLIMLREDPDFYGGVTEGKIEHD